MKLIPKGAKLCTGCPSQLKLKPAPRLIFNDAVMKKQDTKTITIVGGNNSENKKNNNYSLF